MSTTDCKSNLIEIAWLDPAKIEPNPWNPNRMERSNLGKLKAEISRRGFSAPVLARPHGEGWQIVDGEHRFKIAKELGLPLVPAIIVDLDETEARVKTLQMNGLRGENDPAMLARLLAELNRSQAAKKLEARLPWSAAEIEGIVALMEKDLEKARQSFKNPAKAPPPLEMFVAFLNGEQKKVVDKAIEAAREPGDDIAACLARLCAIFLEDHPAPAGEPE